MPKRKEVNLGELQDLIAQGPAGQAKLKKQAEAITVLQETLMLSWKRQKPYEVPVKSEENVIRFGLIGDTQIGSLYQERDALAAYYRRAWDEGYNVILHAGDVLDGWKVYRGQEFELRPDAKSWPEQKKIFVGEMPRHDGQETVFITGNHDASFKNLVGMVVGDELAAARKDWKFIGQDIGDVTLKTPQGQAFKVRLVHPGGGTAYAVSYHSQKLVESIPGGQKPNLVAIGHYHKAEFLPSYRNVSVVQVGTFCGQTPFMVRQHLAAHVGGWLVEVHLNESRKLSSRVRAEFLSFYSEQR